ncbi:MAG: STAS domain-containing protein [Selenomonadaceae bacterium]|nr:STAS domain-containing protein [Selenomonadaceae bacterium]
MKIEKIPEGTTLTIALDGRLDAAASVELSRELSSSLDGINHLVFDLSRLYYLASAGIRIFLLYMKKMDKQGGSMKLIHVQDDVMDILEMSGLTDILHIETTSKKPVVSMN